MGTALEVIGKNIPLGGIVGGVDNDKTLTLAAEKIDPQTRSHLLFPKMLLLNARESLSRLDNKALSELRSYRKPPQTIHLVVKGVLYLFGWVEREGMCLDSVAVFLFFFGFWGVFLS